MLYQYKETENIIDTIYNKIICTVICKTVIISSLLSLRRTNLHIIKRVRLAKKDGCVMPLLSYICFIKV